MVVKSLSSTLVTTTGSDSPGKSEGKAAGESIEYSGGDVCRAVSTLPEKVEKGIKRGLLTGAELGGTTLPVSETVHPLGSPG